MPNKHAAIKDLRKNKKRAERNRRMKMHVKALIGQLQTLVKEGKQTETKALLSKLQQVVAKAGKNDVFHANKASRKISAAYRSTIQKKTS